MTPSELKYHVENSADESHFFSRKSMSFAGDTMRNYGVRSASVVTNYNAAGDYVCKDGMAVECWELYRKRPVKHGLQSSAYFAKDGYGRIFPAQGD